MSKKSRADLPFMPFYVRDYYDLAFSLGFAEHGCYRVLLDVAWMNGGFLPGDEERLRLLVARYSRNPVRTYCKITAKVLAQFFYKDAAGNWRNEGLDIQIEKAEAIVNKQRMNANSRWGGQPKSKPSTAHEQHINSLSNGYATAMNSISTDYEINKADDFANDFKDRDDATAMPSRARSYNDIDNNKDTCVSAHNAPAKNPPKNDLNLFPEGDLPKPENTTVGRWLTNAEPIQESQKVVTIDPIRQARFDVADLFKKCGGRPPETGLVVVWMREGIPAETILTAIESRLPTLANKPLAYFDGIVRELHAARLNPKSFQPAAQTGTRNRTMQDVLNDFHRNEKLTIDANGSDIAPPADQPKLVALSDGVWPD